MNQAKIDIPKEIRNGVTNPKGRSAVNGTVVARARNPD